jgi:hypothetical protein
MRFDFFKKKRYIFFLLMEDSETIAINSYRDESVSNTLKSANNLNISYNFRACFSIYGADLNELKRIGARILLDNKFALKGLENVDKKNQNDKKEMKEKDEIEQLNDEQNNEFIECFNVHTKTSFITNKQIKLDKRFHNDPNGNFFF